MSVKKKYRCKTCRSTSCGVDTHTVTKYRGPESAIGDIMKVILLQLYDMIDIHNLQKHEVMGLIKASLDEHIHEE